LKCLALLRDLSNTEEKNKVIDFCKYEKLDIDIFSEFFLLSYKTFFLS